ncbi:MAG: 16S rRNA (guanine(966)-N(2))-methyltransferase RsmD [Chlamydiales bacterium]
MSKLQIIGGKYKKRKLTVAKTSRPTTSQLRETVFNLCQSIIEGATFLDLFAGSGAMGLEALSRGAAHVIFVEKDRFALAAIQKNIEILGEGLNTTLLAKDVFKALQQLSEQGQTFDLIYVDPPYGQAIGLKVLDFIDNHRLLAEKGHVFIEDTDYEERALNHLKLKSHRKAGRAFIRDYEKSTPDRNL